MKTADSVGCKVECSDSDDCFCDCRRWLVLAATAVLPVNSAQANNQGATLWAVNPAQGTLATMSPDAASVSQPHRLRPRRVLGAWRTPPPGTQPTLTSLVPIQRARL
jgi:hypothetical protein